MAVTERSQAAALLRFVEALEDLDDVQHVHTNADIDPSILDELGGE